MAKKNKTIEQVNDKKNKHLFSKRNIIFMTLFFLITVALMGLTIAFILDIQFQDLFNTLKWSFETNKFAPAWLVSLLGFIFFKTLSCAFFYYILLWKENISATFWEWAGFSLSFLFIACVTPLSIGGEGYAIFWLKTKGLSTAKSTAVTLSSAVLNLVVQILMTWPSFIYICTFDGINQIWDVYWLVIVGLIVDIVGIILLCVTLLTKRINFWLSYVWNMCKRLLKMSYHTKAQIWKKYYLDEEMRRYGQYILFKRWKYSLIVCFSMALLWVWLYSCVWSSMCLVASGEVMQQLSFWTIFSCTNITSTANNFIPLPGAEGTTQILLMKLIKATSNNLAIPDTEFKIIVDNSVLVWRSFTFYFPGLIAMIGFLIMFFKHFRLFKKHKNIFVIETDDAKIKELDSLPKKMNDISKEQSKIDEALEKKTSK